jgi:two-component system nitrogen regulation response regulator GlnG
MPDPSESANLQMSTLRQAADVTDEIATVHVLTILCHPDPSRVGERARLDDLADGYPLSVSRAEPRFASPVGGAARPLGDPYLSRRPLEIAVAAGGKLTLTPAGSDGAEIEIDGRALNERQTVAAEKDIVLQLSRRIVLLLHREPLQRRRQPELDLVGESHALEVVRRRILDAAPSGVSVLVRGESGTGKELVARAIHARSPRATRPFVAVSMAALTPALAISELFGHVRGAFTDARDSRPGLFSKADGGTLFLDEVGQAPPEVQAALLRVLETREVAPVGSDRSRQVDVRLVAATDADLEQAIVDGEFSAPLFHRLAGYEIRLPPLRERIEDIGRLLMHFLRTSLADVGAVDKLGAASDGAPWLPASLVAKLARYPWPGNVRELRNAATQIALSSHRELRARLGDEFERKIALAEASGIASTDGHSSERLIEDSLRPSEISRERLLGVLQECDWNLVRAAAHLVISRTSLYALIEKYGLAAQKKGRARTQQRG